MAEMKKKEYLEHLEPLQVKIVEMQRWVQHSGQRIVVIFEGRDTAGKGGAINCFSQVLNPRSCHVVALPKPSERERTQWYFQRYIAHLPAAGELALFDRSWYNRAGVEKVMGFCTDAEYRRFLDQAPVFEKLLVDEGITLMKYWFSVDQDEQEERFAERIKDPMKRWKISPIDIAARAKYDEYTAARDVFFKATHTRHAPWHVVDANDQRRARLNMITHLLNALPDFKVAEEKMDLPALKRKRLGKDIIGAKAIAIPAKY
ncbi:MAG: polyphosphate kinase 2 [Pseudomonadota bacterium]|nr:polyphosphate kinase 2 [Pseudomonadota bacterium]